MSNNRHVSTRRGSIAKIVQIRTLAQRRQEPLCKKLVAKHYLWALGEGIKGCRPGDLIAGRYLVKRDRLLVDTQPEQLPELPEEIPSVVTPYLRLFAYQLHVPQVYGGIGEDEQALGRYLAARKRPYFEGDGIFNAGDPAHSWKVSAAMRQLNWLWQIAQLWQPCIAQGVATTRR